MFTDNLFSSKVVAAELLRPDEHDPEFVRDYERGGVALRETSAGINQKEWIFFIEDRTIFAKIADTDVQFPIITDKDFIEVVGSFDRNMNPVLVYFADNAYYFYWFDTVTNKYVTEELTSDVSSPRLCHDDKRNGALVYSDVILTYIKDTKLIYRLQRDRFTLNYIAGEKGIKGREIIRFGMNKSLRLQWTLDQATKYRK